MATAQPGVWGIDLGQCALKALRLQVSDGEVVATAFDYIEHPKILSQPDADRDQLTRAALEQFLSRNNIGADDVAISVPGQTGLARFVKLPPVEAKKIPDIVKFEAKQQIPFPLDEVVWDWQSIGSGGAIEGFVEHEIGLFAMKRDMISRELQPFRELKIEVHYIQMAPLALCNFVAYDLLGKGADEGKKEGDEGGGGHECIVSLDIGADNTNLVVTDGGRIIWQRPIPIGGNHFTRALSKEMKLTFAKAEHLKRNATKAEDPKKIFQSMKPVFADFVGELQRSLGFFTNTHRNAQIKQMLGLGNAFRLPGLQKFISQSMGQELEKISQFERLKGDEVLQSPVYSENVLSFGVAYGLALQALRLSKLRTNLLPQEIHFERLIRSKKPYAAAAAAAFLVGLTVFTMTSSTQLGLSAGASSAATDAKRVIDMEARLRQEFQDEQTKMTEARQAALAMLRGAEERTNWTYIHRYVNECLPQPNGDNLPRRYLKPGDPASLDPDCQFSKYFWRRDQARRAYEAKLELDQKGEKDESNLGDLVQINLHGVYARFCDQALSTNLYNNIKNPKTYADETSLLHADWAKPIGKAGWAIEVRGYTYHNDGIRFVRETFLENIRTRKALFTPLYDPGATSVAMDVSHAVVLRYSLANMTTNKSAPFEHINRALYVNELVSVGGGTAAGGAAASRRSGPWNGLGGALGGGGFNDPDASSSAGGAGRANLPNYPGTPGAPGESTSTSTGALDSSSTGASEKDFKQGDRRRTEFVIIFFWEEKLPTDPAPLGGGGDVNQEGLAEGGALPQGGYDMINQMGGPPRR